MKVKSSDMIRVNLTQIDLQHPDLCEEDANFTCKYSSRKQSLCQELLSFDERSRRNFIVSARTTKIEVGVSNKRGDMKKKGRTGEDCAHTGDTTRKEKELCW
jgi:hypothetical protein